MKTGDIKIVLILFYESFSSTHIALKILKGSCLHNLLMHTTHHTTLEHISRGNYQETGKDGRSEI